ncbi:hypothetical protein [Dickeya sp. NCPPB 3274]|nr:hypothetical protein [Dickeya sp. NCPPB 3274]
MKQDIVSFARHVVKRVRKGKRVKIPCMNGAELKNFLITLERVHGYQ